MQWAQTTVPIPMHDGLPAFSRLDGQSMCGHVQSRHFLCVHSSAVPTSPSACHTCQVVCNLSNIKSPGFLEIYVLS